ncbi:unnamed protein product [Trichobilharzia regenti]|nr:unnamed protein product [Trichobilharzia regenti]
MMVIMDQKSLNTVHILHLTYSVLNYNDIYSLMPIHHLMVEVLLSNLYQIFYLKSFID